jgi:dienelactone hydrolase
MNDKSNDDNSKDGGKEAKKVKRGLRPSTKRWLVAIAAVMLAAGVGMGSIVGGVELYDSFFRRYERPDYSEVPGLCCYDRASSIERQELSFFSDGVRLQGYYYPSDMGKGVVVVSHGMHAGADDYLPAIIFFVENGYDVFAYDYKGTYSSDGDSTVGMCEALVDLDNALNFVKSDRHFTGKKIFLFGHSWGGYASTAVLSLHSDIAACAAVAPFNSGYTLIVEKGFQYAGALASDGVVKKFLEVYQKYLFKDYVNYNGVMGINSASCPVLIAHGNNDKVISFGGQSVIAHSDEITNPLVEYYIGEGLQSGHDSIWHSSESVEYKKEVDAEIEKIKKDKECKDTKKAIADYVATVDHNLYSQINSRLFEKILTMFDGQL